MCHGSKLTSQLKTSWTLYLMASLASLDDIRNKTAKVNQKTCEIKIGFSTISIGTNGHQV